MTSAPTAPGPSGPVQRIVAIGDSFTEGMGDPGPDGTPRGWADRVAEAFASAAASAGAPPVAYANLAIRGRRLPQIIDEQVGAALALDPDLVLVNGGGNDLMRPRASVVAVAALTRHMVDRLRSGRAHVYLCSGADASVNLPFGSVLRRRAEELTSRVRAWAVGLDGVTLVDNFGDPAFADRRVWSPDGLHLNARGHRIAAANALGGLGLDVALLSPADGDDLPHHEPSAAWYREHALPWVGRRLARRSSGDGRTAKRPTLQAFG